METSSPPSARRPGGTRRRRGLLHAARAGFTALVLVVLALSLPGAHHSSDVHALRTDLAEAKAALRIARALADTTPSPDIAVGGTFPGAFAAGVARPVSAERVSRSSRDRADVAERQVHHLQTRLGKAVEAATGGGPLAGLAQQVNALMRPSRDEDTVGRLQAPLRGVVTSGFGPRTLPSWTTDHMHDGIDIFALPGAPVTAAAAGTVTFAGHRTESGLSVTVDHGHDHRGRRLHTVYSHLSVIEVREGDVLRAGAAVGTVGNTGTHSTGPHLHFEVRVEGQAVDPRAWL